MRTLLLILGLVLCGVVHVSAQENLGVTTQQQDYFVLGNKAYDEGNYRQALKYYRAAINAEQREVFAWFNLGNTLVQLNKHHLAMVAYRRSSELAPTFVRPWALLGDLYFIHDEMGLAIVCYRRAIEMGENTEHVNYALGEAYLKAGENTLSLKHFEWVLRENPDRIDVYYAMTEVYERIGDFEQAQSVLENAILLSPAAGADVYLYLAHLYLKEEKTKKAIRTIEDALALEPGNVEARRHLADLYVSQESPYMAVFTLEQGMEVKPHKSLALDLAQVYFNQERYDEALTFYQKAWKLGSFSGRIGMENVGHVFFNNGDKERAEEIYQMIR